MNGWNVCLWSKQLIDYQNICRLIFNQLTVAALHQGEAPPTLTKSLFHNRLRFELQCEQRLLKCLWALRRAAVYTVIVLHSADCLKLLPLCVCASWSEPPAQSWTYRTFLWFSIWFSLCGRMVWKPGELWKCFKQRERNSEQSEYSQMSVSVKPHECYFKRSFKPW